MVDAALFSPPLPVEWEAYDAVILGAGISGLVSASVLLKQSPGIKLLVIDEYDHLGGNHIDWSANGYTFDVGSLIFQDDSPLLAHFPELLDLYVPIKPTWGRLNPQGMITAYPISVRDDLLRAGPIGLLRILTSLVNARLRQREMKNAKDFAAYWLGEYLLQRSGLLSYMKRFYGVPAEDIDLDLARKRMLWISEHASLRNQVRRLFRRRVKPGRRNRQMARPRAGFATLYEVAARQLEQRGATFALSTQIYSLYKTSTGFCATLRDKAIMAPRVISTIPIPKLEEICAMSNAQQLGTITLISLYFSFSGKRGFDDSIIYNFSHDGAWKRLTVYSDFYGTANGREYFAVEVIANHVADSVTLAEADFREHVRVNGLFSGDLVLEGSHVLDNAYPIYSKGAADAAFSRVARLAEFGVESHGRQGAFNYQPTARVSTLDAETSVLAHRQTTSGKE
ncbi:NAD(P)-binding protein [Neorhizobium sp. DAR64860/K0K1]|uniref:NAD(P)-binding protein n=1 Tax=Neorhizobium sp. DAR64860/K0K1 TaxID=3421955 RepID=UPI003D29D730